MKGFVNELDKSGLDWWKPRGQHLLNTLHYPVTTSTEEWSNAVMLLDQVIVEGLVPSVLTRVLKDRGLKFQKDWKSLKLIETLLASSIRPAGAVEIVKPLRLLHDLRTKVKGHASGSTP